MGVLTRVTLDKAESYSAPRFEVVRPLAGDELGPYMEARNQARERLIAEPDFSQYNAAPPAPAGRGRAAAPVTRRR